MPFDSLDPSDAIPQTAEQILARVQTHARAAAAPAPRAIADGEQPRTDTERALAAIWMELLHVAAVGVREDFFQLGGHSLLAVQMLVRVRDRYQVELPLQVLFTGDDFTLRRLADVVDAARRAASSPDAVQSALDEIAQLSDDEVERRLGSSDI